MTVLRRWLWFFVPAALVALALDRLLDGALVAAFGQLAAVVLAFVVGVAVSAAWMVLTWHRLPRWVTR